MIGIVGNGFVGNAVYQNFRDKTPCKVYDTDKNRSLNTLSEVIEQDFIFVCLPTPMRYGGECDLSILDNFFEGLPDNITGTFVIKSTVPIGTTKKYYERHNVIHNPEFLQPEMQSKILPTQRETLSVGNLSYAMILLISLTSISLISQVSLPPRMKAKQLNIFLIHSSLIK